jgi:hypothetical protein
MIDQREVFVALQKWREVGANPMVWHLEALRAAGTMQRQKRYKQALAWLGYRLTVFGNQLQERYGPINLGSVTEPGETPRGVVEFRF